MTVPQPQSLDKKDSQHKSSQAHVPTFWGLLQWYRSSYGTEFANSEMASPVPPNQRPEAHHLTVHDRPGLLKMKRTSPLQAQRAPYQ